MTHQAPNNTSQARNAYRMGALAVCAAAALWGLDGVVLTPRLFSLPVPFVVFLLHAVPFLLMQPFSPATTAASPDWGSMAGAT